MADGKISVTEYNVYPVQMAKEFYIMNAARAKKVEHKQNMDASGNTGKTYTFD